MKQQNNYTKRRDNYTNNTYGIMMEKEFQIQFMIIIQTIPNKKQNEDGEN